MSNSPGSQAASRTDQGSRGSSSGGKSSGSNSGNGQVSRAPGGSVAAAAANGDASARAMQAAQEATSRAVSGTGGYASDQGYSTPVSKVTMTPGLPGTDPYHANMTMADLYHMLSNGVSIAGGGLGMVGTVGDMLSGGALTNATGGLLGAGNFGPADGSSTYNGRAAATNSQGTTANELNGGQQQFDTQGNPISTVTNSTDPSTLTLDNIYKYLGDTTGGSDLYYLQQRGLAPLSITPDQWAGSGGVPNAGTSTPTDPAIAALHSQYDPVFQREFDRVKSTVPTALTGTGTGYDTTSGQFDNQTDYDTALQQIANLFPTTFGNQALDAEQTRQQNTNKTAVSGLGFEGQIDKDFGDTSDDDIINSIYNQQYDPAMTQISNALKRGALTPQGYNYAVNTLNKQGDAGKAKLQSAGADERATLSGGLNDYLSTIYDKASGWQLGQSAFDPTQYTDEFNSRLGSAQTQLSGDLEGNVPNIFDIPTVLQGAGSVQGVTNRGGLLDTLADRGYQKRNATRGVGSTGAF